jgi:hypothetical protein
MSGCGRESSNIGVTVACIYGNLPMISLKKSFDLFVACVGEGQGQILTIGICHIIMECGKRGVCSSSSRVLKACNGIVLTICMAG